MLEVIVPPDLTQPFGSIRALSLLYMCLARDNVNTCEKHTLN